MDTSGMDPAAIVGSNATPPPLDPAIREAITAAVRSSIQPLVQQLASLEQRIFNIVKEGPLPPGSSRFEPSGNSKHAPFEMTPMLQDAKQLCIVYCGKPDSIDRIAERAFCTEMFRLEDGGTQVSNLRMHLIARAGSAAGRSGYRTGYDVSSIQLYYVDEASGRGRLLVDKDRVVSASQVVMHDAEKKKSLAASAIEDLPEDVVQEIFKKLHTWGMGLLEDVGMKRIRGLVCVCEFTKQ